MIFYPKLKAKAPYRQRLEVFKGYNHNLRIGSGEFYEMENLTSEDYPVLSTRKKRGQYLDSLQDGGEATGMLYVSDVGMFVVVEHFDPRNQDSNVKMCTLLLIGADGERSVVGSLSAGPKSMALMGKHLIIAPDMIEVDTDTLRPRQIENAREIKSGRIYFQMCREDGTLFAPVTSSQLRPEDPTDGAYWLELHGNECRLWQYSAIQQDWITVSSTYVKMWGEGLSNHLFRQGDAVDISGILPGNSQGLSELNGSHVIGSCDQDGLVIDGLIPSAATMECSSTDVIKIVRGVPQMDFIVESGNRIWGCSRNVNEIYACKLGDYKNWHYEQKLSTDSWVGNVGTPGEFTGAVVQNGYPIFYKEHCKHKVWPSANCAHQITTVLCDGVEKGSENSLAVYDGTVFYKSTFGVFADDGGGPVEIGQALGNIRYRNGMGAVHDRKYYLSLQDGTGERSLFVYDIARGIWHRQNGIPGVICSAGESLFGAYGEIWDLTGNTGTPEEQVSWMAVTGDLGLENPEQKYISRLTLRLCLEPGATMEIYAQYDREQTWVKLGQVYGTELRSFSLPVRPRRCDQLRLKLQGTGMCKLYSITKTLERGSELP